MAKCIYLFILFLIHNLTGLSQNYCLRFFGNGSNDIDRVKISIDNPEKPVDVGENFTIEFQIKADLANNPNGAQATEGANDDWTLGHVIIDRDIFGNGDYGDYGISLVNGKIAFGVNNGNQSYTIISNSNVADNQWHFVAVTRQQNNGELKIYIDGILDKSIITNVTGDISYRNQRNTSWINDPYLVIGAEKHDYDAQNYPSFNGFLDELRISNIVRYTTAAYLPILRFQDDSNTVGLYHFDEGNGTIVHDSALIAGNQSHGIINFGGNPYGPLWVINDISTSISIPSSTFNHFLLYPNPTTHYINFLFEDKEFHTVVIYDAIGKKIDIQQLHIFGTIDVSHLPPGIYWIEIHRYYQKLIKL